MISRPLIASLALIAAVAQVSRGLYVEAAGLASLAVGIAVLRWAPPSFRWAAWVAFAGTAAAMVASWMRMQGG